MKTDIQSPYRNVEQTASFLGLAQCYVRKQIAEGKCPHIKVGRKILVNLPLYMEMLEDQAREFMQEKGRL